MKNERQMMILEIIGQENIETQEQLLTRLQERGVSSTQATISRDIKQMHLIKEPVGRGVYKYSVSGNRTRLNFAEKLRTIFRESITSIDSAQNIVVVKTMLAFSLILISKGIYLYADYSPVWNGIFNFLLSTAILSIGLGLFNLIPIPPLDGSKVLGALLPDRAYFKLMRYERYGMLLLILLSFANVGGGLISRAITAVYTAMTIGETVGTLAVTGGLTTSLPLVAADSFSWPLAQGEKLEVRFELPKSLRAPVTAGTSAGQAVFSLNGKEVGRVELLCGRDALPAIQPPASLLRHLRTLMQGG